MPPGDSKAPRQPSGRKYKPRQFRAPDPLWEAAQEAVRHNGHRSVSDVIRRALEQYVRETNRRLGR